MAQTLNFEDALKNLYFGVDIKKASSNLVDTFMTVPFLQHSDKVASQRNVNINLQLETDNDAWSYRHIFTFSKSPLSDLKINSGYIEVSIGKAPGIKKLLDVNWCVQFDEEVDAEIFYNKLVETFTPVSTLQKIEYDIENGHTAQYSTRKEGDKGFRDIAFSLGKSSQTKKFEIRLLLMNEFMEE